MTGIALAQDERYTLDETMAWVRHVTQVHRFDVDVAACRESHWAKRWYSVRQNGLSRARPWRGRVWCNPPYSDIEPWIRRAWDAMAIGEAELVAMLVPATRSEQPWWQGLVEPWRDRVPRRMGARHVQLSSHFLPGRTRFGHPSNVAGHGVGSPPFTCVLLVWAQMSARWRPKLLPAENPPA